MMPPNVTHSRSRVSLPVFRVLSLALLPFAAETLLSVYRVYAVASRGVARVGRRRHQLITESPDMWSPCRGPSERASAKVSDLLVTRCSHFSG